MPAGKTRTSRTKALSQAVRRIQLRPVGVIRSSLKNLDSAPMQGPEGAPDAWLEVDAFAQEAIDGLRASDEIVVITWLHQSDRRVMKVHPRSDPNRPRAYLPRDHPTGLIPWGFIQ